jgi:hypothetical protein
MVARWSRAVERGRLALSAAESVIYFDPSWNPAVEAQVTDRAPRRFRTLAPAKYTAIVRGANHTTGVALVEVYALQ